ncbi:MAG: hypothetical protein KA792_10975, partial [Bacteroidales bacterium]|nr:hypothetical protein [Bacteroidales bacterium]
MNIEKKIKAFSKLGNYLQNATNSGLNKLIKEEHYYNPWFTEKNVKNSLSAISVLLEENNLRAWLEKYNLINENKSQKIIGLVLAGNIPLVGFSDFLSVLISGNKLLCKLSSDDKRLLPALANILIQIEPGFKDLIVFTEGLLKGFDAVIATGSNNTARYFEYYFGKYPHIIRKNRNAVAVLTAKENNLELKALADDIFMYFGLGCRNVSKIYVPLNYNFDDFINSIEDYRPLINHNKYCNNYEYNKAIFLINNEPYLDNGFLLIKENVVISSPVAVLNYEYYTSQEEIKKKLDILKDKIQCIVGVAKEYIPFGKAQFPQLW